MSMEYENLIRPSSSGDFSDFPLDTKLKQRDSSSSDIRSSKRDPKTTNQSPQTALAPLPPVSNSVEHDGSSEGSEGGAPDSRKLRHRQTEKKRRQRIKDAIGEIQELTHCQTTDQTAVLISAARALRDQEGLKKQLASMEEENDKLRAVIKEREQQLALLEEKQSSESTDTPKGKLGYDQVFANAQVPMCLATLDMRIIDMNSKFADMIGVISQALPEITCMQLSPVADYHILFALMQRLMSGESDSGSVIKRIKRLDGREISVFATFILVRERNVPSCVLVTIVPLQDEASIQWLKATLEEKNPSKPIPPPPPPSHVVQQQQHQQQQPLQPPQQQTQSQSSFALSPTPAPTDLRAPSPHQQLRLQQQQQIQQLQQLQQHLQQQQQLPPQPSQSQQQQQLAFSQMLQSPSVSSALRQPLLSDSSTLPPFPNPHHTFNIQSSPQSSCVFPLQSSAPNTYSSMPSGAFAPLTDGPPSMPSFTSPPPNEPFATSDPLQNFTPSSPYLHDNNNLF